VAGPAGLAGAWPALAGLARTPWRRAALAVRDLDRAGARGGGEVRVDRERRPRIDELGPRLEQRLAGREQDVARAVADRDARLRHVVALAQTFAQQRVGRVRVAVEVAERVLDRLSHRGQRRIGRLVARKADERRLFAVAARDRVGRQPRDAL